MLLCSVMHNYVNADTTFKISLLIIIGMMDHLHNHSESDAHAGVPVILPSSFSGSPRAMQQNYQDAMAIVAKYMENLTSS